MIGQRTISGIVLSVVLIGGVTLLPTMGVWLLFMAVSSVAQMEFYRLMNKAGIPVFRWLGVFFGAAMISTTFRTIDVEQGGTAQVLKWEHLVMVAALMTVFVRQFPQKHNSQPVATIACTLFGIWYVPYLFNFLTRLGFTWDGTDRMLSAHHTGWLLIFYLVLVVKCTDMGAYFTGSAFGRHKMIPRLSPAKSWEGLAGGLAAGLAASLVFVAASRGRVGRLELSWADATALGVLLPAAGTLGDLFESLIKRAAAAKDAGGTIPGMGGFLDVLDSVLFGAPVLYIYLRLFVA